MSTFSRLWAKHFWAQYPQYQPNFVDYSLQIIKIHICIVLTQSQNSVREENKHGFE